MSAANASNSGIKKLRTGESVIPSSTRADGSVRKEIRVKPGYRPPEDVEVYKNRTAEAWKHRGKGGVPGAEVAGAETQAQQLSASTVKNAKRREARKKAAANAGDEDDKDDKVEEDEDEKAEVEVDPDVEKAKEARKLAKKFRQARELQDKKNEGGSLLPEQLAKVIKMNELVRQLDNLGFDTEGEKKQGANA